MGPSRNPVLPSAGLSAGGVIGFVVVLLIIWSALSVLIGWWRAGRSGRPSNVTIGEAAFTTVVAIIAFLFLAPVALSLSGHFGSGGGASVSRQGIPAQPKSLPQWGQRYPIYDPNTPDHLQHYPDGSIKLGPPLGSETPPLPPPGH